MDKRDYKEEWKQQNEDIKYLLRQLERIDEIVYNTHMSSKDKIEFIMNLDDEDIEALK